MKKLLSLAAAFICAATASLTASAYGELIDITSPEYYWDYEETVEYEEEVDFSVLPQPYVDNSYAGETNVCFVLRFDRRWAFDEIVAERRLYGKTKWSEAGTIDIWEDSSEYRVSFNDTECVAGRTYEYRFTFLKEIDGQMTEMSQITEKISTAINAASPEITASTINDTSVKFTLKVDKKWAPKGCQLLRYNYDDGTYTVVYTDSTRAVFDDDNYRFDLKDKGLTPNTSYTYYFSVYRTESDKTKTEVCTCNTTITTDYVLEKPKMLEPEATSNSITLTATIDERYKADGFVVQKYNTTKKSWVTVKTDGELSYYGWGENYCLYSANYTAEKLNSATEYKYRIRFYRNVDGKKRYLSTVSSSVYTLLPTPVLTLGATKSQSNLSWNPVSGASGYEIYIYKVDSGKDNYYDGYWWYGWYDTGSTGGALSKYNQNYESNTLSYIDSSNFKKCYTIKDGATTKMSFKRAANKVHVFKIRAYKTVGKKKLYSGFSNQATTDSTESLLNGITLNPTVTVSDYDLKLIKAAVNECIKPGMSQAEKAAAVYDYVHNIATYEYDYSKIPIDCIEAILVSHCGQCYQYAVTYQAIMKYLGFNVKLIGGKTSSGGPHWWNELEIDGKQYMIDPQVGGRFMITYQQVTVYKEQTYN